MLIVTLRATTKKITQNKLVREMTGKLKLETLNVKEGRTKGRAHKTSDRGHVTKGRAQAV